MKAEDLMVGDYLMHYGFPYRVIQVDGIVRDGWMIENGEEDCGEPIPITPEILEKNGWVYNNDDEKFFPQTWVGGGLMLQGADDYGYRIVVTSDYDDEDTNNTPFIILYVHELQHALRLRGIKKEIIL